MEFGRLKNIDHVDFSFPADHKGVKKVLGGQPAKTVEVYVGCPVWAHEGLAGKIYPPKSQSKDYLKHYSRQFNSIELNATLYQVPSPVTVTRWTDSVNDHFKFCPKIHESISHSEDISKCRSLIHHLHEIYAGFGKKLGTCLLQLPPNFNPAKLDLLLDFLDHCPVRDLAIELRHEGWFGKTEALDTLSNYLYKNNFCLCITDVAGRRDVLHMRLANKTAFIRFTANNLHPTDFRRLDDWINRIIIWIGQGLEKIYFFVHTPDKSLCPELAIYFIENLNKKTGLNIVPPAINKNNSLGLF
jgi:uncharacterized protein YecE (DUF72 family)